uniref:Putative secreted protein n=1 Tax=Ixodes scapularis TaxID=6945 RepID=A0A4D5RCY2_IXOSC
MWTPPSSRRRSRSKCAISCFGAARASRGITSTASPSPCSESTPSAYPPPVELTAAKLLACHIAENVLEVAGRTAPLPVSQSTNKKKNAKDTG